MSKIVADRILAIQTAWSLSEPARISIKPEFASSAIGNRVDFWEIMVLFAPCRQGGVAGLFSVENAT